ncbi:MAG: PH domain-containing protein [Galbitalea sp.]
MTDPAPDGDPAEDLLPRGAVLSTRLADGQWHRLHPATPLLRGGFVLIAIAGFVLSQARQQLVDLVVGGPRRGDGGDPLAYLTTHGRLPLALLVVAAVLIVIVGVFYLSWRVHEFRITDEVVEVQSGLLRRSLRKGRLDRIQGVNVVRPFVARLFGAARLEIDVAGHDANVRLDYLSSSNADGLRSDLLRLASGSRAQVADQAAPETRGLIGRRVSELTAPELDPAAAPPESVVRLHVGRLIGSILLHDTTFTLLVLIAAAAIASAFTGRVFVIYTLVPLVFALGGFLFRRFTKSLRYSIAATPDGVRVGFGLFTLSNETLPPGRIHAIQVRQPLLWRLAGWWEIRVNRASKSNARGADAQRNTTILPVGNLDDVLRVLDLLLPGTSEESLSALRRGIVSSGSAGGFTNSPRRALIVHPLSWRRNGFTELPGTVLLRAGAVRRRLTIVHKARVQSVGLTQGPLDRALRLANIHVHTVHGPVAAETFGLDRDAAIAFFSHLSGEVVQAIGTDSTHRWREEGASA